MVATAVTAQSTNKGGKPVMWEPVNIKARDLYFGPGGRSMVPDVRRVEFIRKETGGNNLKYRIKDAKGRTWVAKIADESQPETAANRLLWAIGYRTEVDYLLPRLAIPGKKVHENVRLEARPDNVERDGRWSWESNPFVGKPEFQGLKLMMALMNNWDLKDTNTVVFQTRGERQYVVSDLGATFGKLSFSSNPILTRLGRSVNKPKDYAKAKFIKSVEPDGFLNVAYSGKDSWMMDDLRVEDAQWLAKLLKQLSDKQISDAFRAANYSGAEISMLTQAVKARIRALDTAGVQFEARR